MCQKCTHSTVSEANKIHIIANHRYYSTLGTKDTKRDDKVKEIETRDKKASRQSGRRIVCQASSEKQSSTCPQKKQRYFHNLSAGCRDIAREAPVKNCAG